MCICWRRCKTPILARLRSACWPPNAPDWCAVIGQAGTHSVTRKCASACIAKSVAPAANSCTGKSGGHWKPLILRMTRGGWPTLHSISPTAVTTRVASTTYSAPPRRRCALMRHNRRWSHLQTALTLLEPDDPQRGGLLLALGEAALMATDETTAMTAFATAQTWFEDQGESIASARAAYGCGIAHWRLDEAAAAQQALEAALALLATAPSPEPVTVPVLVALANLLGVVLGRQDEAIHHARQALEIAQRLEDRTLQASAGRTVGFLLVRDNELAAGIPLLEQALAQAQRGDDPVEAAACCAYLAQAYCWSAALERSQAVSLLREEYTHTCPQPHQQSYVYSWLAFLSTLRGAWAEAEQDLALAQPAVESVASLEPRAFFQQVRGFLAFQRGDYRQAERELRAGIEVFRTQDPGELLLCLGLFGLVLLAVGKYREARACMAEQERLIETLAAGSLSTLSARGCVALMAVQDERRGTGSQPLR